MKKIIQLIFIAISGILVFSCNKEEITTDSNIKLQFSTDTVSFDTVFTSIGSTTRYFIVKNPASKAVNISSIHLAGDENSPFRLNINGITTNNGTDITIYGKDSIYIFVEATIDPSGQNLPMVVHDSIVFNINNNTQDVNLIAFGQDFHLLNGEILKSQHWENDKPYLIYNSILVDSLETLTIDPGCRIHFHEGSSLFVQGTLKVNGTFEEPVTFQGDRLEKSYADVPGQWGAYVPLPGGGIYVYGGLHFLSGSINNQINYATIKNAEKGIQVDTLGISENPVLVLQNSRIENMSLNCLDGRTTFLEASNCVFANSGSFTVALRFGGNYKFNHCTIANYTGSARNTPALFFNNFYKVDDKTYSFTLNANINNCIVYGNGNNEVSYENVNSALFNVHFNTCLLNTVFSGQNNFVFTNSLLNKDPKFINPYENDYTLDSSSPARDIGDIEIARFFPLDLKNNSRLSDDGPDLGALEWIPEEN